ncbi:MAG: HEPN domain-containing protein [Anaerolineales bacterium]|nr:HEPN domain-containing protein [Chloroflexota bacterium]MBL6982728.1 HEPN domain-containing protein [Anaerolineales bacterium]
MTEIKELVEKAEDSIKAAETLLRQSFSGFAASRAYYAMFYLAQAFLLDKELTFSSHAAVIAAFGKEYAKTKLLDPKFHRYLILSQSERQVGDYGIGESVNTEDTRKLITWAKEFLEVAKEHLL